MAGQETSSNYWQEHIETILGRMADPAVVRRNFTFFESQDPEARRRAYLPNLFDRTRDDRSVYSEVKFDEEGYIYVSSWRQVKGIPGEYKVFGRTQPSRDYSEYPPKTKVLERHGWDQIKGGVDVALRREEDIRGRYHAEGGESAAIMAVFSRLSALRAEMRNFPDLSEEDINRIMEENMDFLEGTPGFTRPRLRGKKRIARHMGGNIFLDRNGRKNYGAGQMRLFATELELRKRWEGAFPPILGKMALVVEILQFERDFARGNLELAIEDLGRAVELGPNLGNWFFNSIPDISFRLNHHVVVRPYSLGARKVVEMLGATTMQHLDVSSKVQAKRTDLTVTDLLKERKFDQAQALIQESAAVLQRVLDANLDYRTVKKKLKVKSKSKKSKPN